MLHYKPKTYCFIPLFLFFLSNNMMGQGQIDWKEILLHGNSNLQVEFDFCLTNDGQRENIQRQIEKDLCDGIYPINTIFEFPDKSIETLLLFENYCPVTGNTSHPVWPLLGPVIIFINKNDQLLLDGKLASMENFDEKLRLKMEEYVEEHFRDFASFAIIWAPETKLALRRKVFKSCVKAYLCLMKQKALKRYGVSIDKLSTKQLEALKKELRFALYLRYPVPPLPPNGLEESKYDTTESGLEKR